MSECITPQQARALFETAQEIRSAAQVTAAVAQVAAAINSHAGLRDAQPLAIVVLRGAIVFAGQLLPQLTFPLATDSIDATRYSNTTQGGDILFRSMPVADVAGRTILLIDDILDEGITLLAIRDKLLAMKAHQVMIAVFAEKLTGNTKPLAADFVGMTLPNRYVFGFGMDVHGYWRNLPSIHALRD